MGYELYHYGILGMHWGIRRYQNKDGSLTAAGRKRYGGDKGQSRLVKDVSQINTRISELQLRSKTAKNSKEIEFLKSMRNALVGETADYYSSSISDSKKLVSMLEKKDLNWAKTNYDRITDKIYSNSKQELYEHKKQLDQEYGGKIGRNYINDFNQKYAEIMTKNASEITAPSGRAVKFVAKRAEYGVMMALADANYDMSQLKNGVWSSGRIAYKKKQVNINYK